MIPIPKESTTIVDLGSGVFGERTAENAEQLVNKRLEDLMQLKSQFEGEAAMLTQRLEELATAFETAASEMTKSSEETEPEEEKAEEKQTRRRRKFGGELTLDD